MPSLLPFQPRTHHILLPFFLIFPLFLPSFHPSLPPFLLILHFSSHLVVSTMWNIRSWLDTCSSASCTTATLQSTVSTLTKQHHLPSDASSSFDTPSSRDTTAITSTCTSNSSLHTNLSVQTHPSVPSLQNLPTHDFNYVVSQHCLASLKPNPSQPLTCLADHGDLLYAASSHQINIYDRHTRINLRSFGCHDSSSRSTKAITFCNDMVFTTHQDYKIRVWKLLPDKKYQMVTALPTVNDYLLRFLLPKNYVTVRRHRKQLWIQHADAVTGLAVYNEMIYSVSWDKSMKIWHACDLRCLESVKAYEDAVNAVIVSKDGIVYTGSTDKRIRVWSQHEGEKRHVLVATLEKLNL